MDRKIGVIASDRELKQSIVDLFSKDVEDGNIIIDILDLARIEEQGKLLEAQGAEAIVGRSGGYRHTVGKVTVPVVHLRITTLDILQAIRKADKLQKDIVVVLSDIEYFEGEEWEQFVTGKLIVEKFNNSCEIEAIVNKYSLDKDKYVIVGGGIPCKFASQLEMDFVHIGASRESIYDGITYAKELANKLYEQRFKNEVLRTTLDAAHDAVVAIDQYGRVVLYNKIAEGLLRKSSNDIMNKNLSEVCPELNFMLETLKSRENRYNEIITLKKAVVAANTSVLEVDGHFHGVICSFQDITKLQVLEKKIRYELNKKGLVAKYTFDDIIAVDPVMKDTVAKALRIGITDSTVMIYGESGTGKEMIAQSIHNVSERKDEPFVAINCAAISETLLESELFGYEEGAFTGARKGGKPGLFELAHGGTIFLDEINSISPNLQAKLLRVLEEKEVMRIGSDYVIPLNVRVIAAANEKLKSKVEEGRFRSDLFYRLCILELHIPTLRERKKDIIPLFKFYLEKLSKGNKVLEINKDIEEKLLRYSWPGNVRELKNIAQRYIIFGEVDLPDENIKSEEKMRSEEKEVYTEDGASPLGQSISLKEINRYVEEKVIEMLEKRGMNKTEIAKQLGISRTALWKKTKGQ